MIRRIALWTLVVAILITPTAAAQQPSSPQSSPGPRGWARRCAAVLPRQTVDPIVARYRDRLRAARENLRREERALRALLIAETSTRAAVDAQSQKVIDARNALLRSRLDMLWDLRSVIPPADRDLAFRCAWALMMRRR
ncbi:MAG: periplasmic heavy metal sensor [Armatimonadota bacterium]|nr:periplasmic heavy metal sensor [Armatimonadota bacterium]MDR7450911.1 periplasmic heavy metal sensor [Armatimonadota bacterium]MDR7465833.1 periplasmic heavy metal sensor [Armatimonadota bacterium]MDR7493741.1 periplasmic heavy metal sensor [Armatimonadota bacterium]MDR7498347.1 periplasmic heavy metal sensor [Armatimonadota bacterium]